MSTPIVQLSAVDKSFGTQQVLQSLDWQIKPGQVIGLLGRNGAGKSTLIECMLGLRERTRGSAQIYGEEATQLSDGSRARIGYVPQQSELFEWLTPTQLLNYFRAFYPRWNQAKVDGLLGRWSIDCKKTIGKLSGGEKQRLSIIRALAHDPDLLILDEPVASLDPFGRRDFLRELIDGVIERNTTVVFSTHILSDLERIALDVAFLKDGKIKLQTGLDELMESVRRVSGPRAAIEQLSLKHAISHNVDANGTGTIVAQLDAGLIASIASQPQLAMEAMSLEDLFVEVTQ